jgi:murein DD-endopeptidase MepM/ murein hydrolase activator NlpD
MKLFCTIALFLCLSPTVTLAQASGPNGFDYPVASITTAATFLETGCHGYISGDYHLGWDLAQSHGSPVYALTNGTIVNVTNTGDPDVTFIWIQHQAVDPANGNTFTFWAVYGHTSIAAGLGQGSSVRTGQVIGYTIVYPTGDHCHLGINRVGIVTQAKNYTLSYVNGSGQNATATVQAGWGRGGLPSDWCGHDSQNVPLLQASAAIENFTNPESFLNTYRAVGYVVNSTDLYVDSTYNGSQTGSSANPFKTVTQAINAAGSTQAVTMHVKPGTYHESVTIHKNIHIVTWGSGTVSIGG